MRARLFLIAAIALPALGWAREVRPIEDHVGDAYSIMAQTCEEPRDGEGCLRYFLREEVLSVTSDAVVLRLSLENLQTLWDDDSWMDVEERMRVVVGEKVFPVEVRVVRGAIVEVRNYREGLAALDQDERNALNVTCEYEEAPCSRDDAVSQYAGFVLRRIPTVEREHATAQEGVRVSTAVVRDDAERRVLRTRHRGRFKSSFMGSVSFTEIDRVEDTVTDVLKGYVSEVRTLMTARTSYSDDPGEATQVSGGIVRRTLVARGP